MMMCSILPAFLLLLFFLPKGAPTNSKLILHIGKGRFEVDGTTCSVGVAFPSPTLIKCACLNGVWAFYGADKCTPLSIIAGKNHCFRLPKIPVIRITSISNPLEALGDTLTFLKDGGERVQQKVYRSTHPSNPNPTDLIAVNSSWVVVGGGGRFCLDSSPSIAAMMEGGGFGGSYCTFSNLSRYTPDLWDIVKGCKGGEGETLISPTECQPILQGGPESVCTKSSSLRPLQFPYTNELEFSRQSRKRQNNNNGTATSAAKKSGKSSVNSTEQSVVEGVPSERALLEEKYPRLPPWLRKDVEEGRIKLNETRGGNGTGTTLLTEEEMVAEMESWWGSLKEFSNPHLSPKENPLIVQELWKYEESALKTVLKLEESSGPSRKAHPTESMISKLLNLSRKIVRKICPPPTGGGGAEDLGDQMDIALHIFLALQSKLYDWKGVALGHLDFKRIEGSLTRCMAGVEGPLGPFAEVSGEGGCVGGADTSVVLPPPLLSRGYDPLIEMVWKMFLSVHSYCYKNFDKLYSDHHKFTTVITPLFGGGLKEFWVRREGVIEGPAYGSILGDLDKSLEHYDKCASAARISSSFPFHMTRPIPPDEEEPLYLRMKSSNGPMINNDSAVKVEPSLMESSAGEGDEGASGMMRKKRDVLGVVRGDEDWKRERRIFGGAAYCLKKYNEPKQRLQQECN